MIKINKQEAYLLSEKYGTPLFLYDELEIIKRASYIKKAFNYKNTKILFAIKANSNISILKLLKKQGLLIDASSPGDVFLAKHAGYIDDEIYATGPNWSDDDLEYFIENNIHVDLDSISQIERYGRKNPNSAIGIRINPGVGTGSYENISAGGEGSKLGIQIYNFEKAIAVANKYNLKILGLHFHIGSSSFETKPFITALKKVMKLLKQLDNIQFINIGGGYGVSFDKNETDFDLKKYGKEVVGLINEFNKLQKQKIQLRVETGEFLMWKNAIAITKINTIKYNKKYKFVGVDINTNSIQTPLLYNSYHHIRTFNRQNKEIVHIAGNLCFSGDLLAKNRKINIVKEGEIIVIENAGAYCMVKGSHFNSRLLPTEILRLRNGKYKVIRKEKLTDLLIGQIL